MTKYFPVIFFFFTTHLLAQEKYWQQEVHYTITTELNDKENSLTSFESLVYKNNSPQTLDFIWFHIWPNAYKNEPTALYEQISEDPFLRKKMALVKYGSISGLSFEVNGITSTTEAHSNPKYIDIIKLILPKPLKPGDSITISTPFKVKLPSYFSRSGYAGDKYMICQWYPKPAVYDKDGWHEFPYLDMGEFYSEYASYKVSITLPSQYVVSATGALQTGDELRIYKQIGSKNAANREIKPELYPGNGKNSKKTLRYFADKVPDFAWFANKEFVIQYDTVKLASGKIIDAFSYYYGGQNSAWRNSIDYIKDGLKHYSSWLGEYAYPVVQAVEGPHNNSSGGMEYPMVTLITAPDADGKMLDVVISHEVGHNWFMSMLGTNERQHAWMDEGLNTFFQFRYEAEKYKTNYYFGNAIPAAMKEMSTDEFLKIVYQALQAVPIATPIETPSANFVNSNEYSNSVYLKAALWMYMLQSAVGVGQEKMDQAFKNYFTKWQFKHPQPEDLRQSFEESIGKKLNSFFDLLNKAGNFK